VNDWAPWPFGRAKNTSSWGAKLPNPRISVEHTARLINEEIQHIVQTTEDKAEQLLTQYREQLDALAQALLKHETLDAADVEWLLDLDGAGLYTKPRSPAASLVGN
jgi:cell division protease FtsH